jgi:hypothetical protein
VIEVARTEAKRFEEPPLSWHPAWFTDHVIPLFTCPGGSTGSLGEWSVAADGAVSPSVDCHCGCGFHDYVRLLNWDPNWEPRGA